ncbi:MAG: molybdopterin molybdotransferase MoeA [Cardiobacteriaceae bacterium]|nr:molybdopterin molybdotransferase MoeA [Cardiobacteriaceae bacterium]
MLTLDELNALIAAALPAREKGSESIALHDAPGRILAEDLLSPLAIPGADVSAMDGYAFYHDGSTRLALAGESIAGKPFAGTLQAGECVRIMTGAVVPEGADTVEMQENVAREGDHIVLQHPAKTGKHIRRAGEEVKPGDAVLAAGQILSAADILLLAALGQAQVTVRKRLKIGIFSTGDELVAPGAALTASGQIYDSNRALLIALLQELPVDIIDGGIVRDDPAAIKQTLTDMGAHCDAILTSGGVSVGDYDFLKDAVAALGEIQSYKVKMKPGKPFVFGRVGNAAYFGLPGNPVSSFVGFSRIVRPALWQMAGADPAPAPFSLVVPLAAPVRKAPGRQDFQRGLLQQTANGWQVAPQGAQDSHRIYGLARANCLIDLAADSGDVAAGDAVTVWPFFSRFAGGG